jgi:hypothetical protein
VRRVLELGADRGRVDYGGGAVLGVVADREHVPDPAAQLADVLHADLLAQLARRAVREVGLEHEVVRGEAAFREVHALAGGDDRLRLRAVAKERLLPMSRQMHERVPGVGRDPRGGATV